MSNAIVLIVLEPKEVYLDFLATFTQYDIYILIDSKKNQTVITTQSKYKSLNFVQLPEHHCINNGFQNVNYVGIKKVISGWDKALLFFSVMIPLKYDHVWFIEDDVFFLNEQVLKNLDAKYPNQDLIANCDFDKTKVTSKTMNKDWVWPLIDIKIEKPYYAGMMCIARISSSLLQSIRWYAATYKTLFFLEALFPTITSHFSLSYANPSELTTVTYRDIFFDEESDTFNGDLDRVNTHVFHPIKDETKHDELRARFMK
jgi:hypothetical protein